MSELVVVVSDLYLAARSIPREAGARVLPGLARLGRYGAAERLPGGWRPWLARWLGRPDLAASSPAAIAAAALAAARTSGDFLWLADPVHLVAGMTSLHLAPGGLLALDPPAQAALCGEFNESFAELGYRLAPTRSGRFLASGPAPPGAVEWVEPARMLGSSIAEAVPRGAGAARLLSLGAEIEMWLHEHPLNARRMRAGLPPISTLWLWGGGARLEAREADRAGPAPGGSSPAALIFSDDAYMAGLAQLAGARITPEPDSLAQAVAERAPRRIVTLELFGPTAQQGSEPIEALERLDREWISPALRRLARRELARLTLIANDRRLTISAADRLKVWRRRRAVREVLQ